jgi:hypothetical protein
VGPLSIEEVLAEEALKLAGPERHAAALLLQGHAPKQESERHRIRSATFCLGVIQALAAHDVTAARFSGVAHPIKESRNSLIARPVSVSLDRLGRRLHRIMAVVLAQSPGFRRGLAWTHQPTGWAQPRAAGAFLASGLQQLPHASRRCRLGGRVGRACDLFAQSPSQLAGLHPRSCASVAPICRDRIFWRRVRRA